MRATTEPASRSLATAIDTALCGSLVRAARECLVAAIGNVDILLEMLSGMTALFSED
ncbi:hypothetical protein SAMN05216275_11314 [Streptosporangium canum]|uniref:Uncharacterized protein n=1 Tax=Streptosporangium canum TaxID=324952 RepID=A0A1I3UR03_9ACTN|nr:hypothetical protein [Streptosporangium canum]SFJ84251.1 hypothetical protein SAMN05216275_11314 [Streptosporangium canum]